MSNASIFERITERLTQTDDVFAEEFAEEFVRKVKARTPVRTGRLQGAWDWDVSSNEITIENLTDYAGYVEDGTERMAGAHMLKTTLSEVGEIARRIVEDNK